MRIARGPIGLRYALVLVTVPGLAACGLLDSDVDAQRVDRANVSVEQTTPPASTDDADAEASPTPRTTSETPASRKTERSSPTKKSSSAKKKTSTAPTKKKTTKPAPKPTPPTTRPASSGSGSTSTKAEREVLRLVNVQREKAGCKPVREDSLLVKVARAHSKDMAVNNYFSHNSRNGRTPFERMSRAGYEYSYAAENIAAGQQTAAAVMRTWMNSEGHRKNILNCKLKELGVGMWKQSGSAYGIYWTQDFGTPS